MANYFFETMTQSQAAIFTAADTLIFSSTTPTQLSITDNLNTGNQIMGETITLAAGSQSLIFSAQQLSGASTSNHFIFQTSDALNLGYAANDTITGSGTAGHTDLIYGFSGTDTITGTAANDIIYGGQGADTIQGVLGSGATASSTEQDYLNGGSGADQITGSAGNDHIFGYSSTAVSGQTGNDTTDNDTLIGGAGNDYIQGNAGNDSIDGGADNDRIFGGADNDTVTGGLGNDAINGNKGNDLLYGNAGNDVVHGGQGNDTIYGDDTVTGTAGGNDVLFGDLGNDSIVGGQGHDTMTGDTGAAGGTGVDTFGFGTVVGGTMAAPTYASDAAFTTGTAAGAYVGDEITDFTHGTDKINIVFGGTAGTGATATPVDGVYQAQNGATFTTASAALTYAQQLLDNDTGATTHTGHEVAAIQVGSDTYLFYVSSGADGGTIDSSIKLDGVTATTLTTSDFV